MKWPQAMFSEFSEQFLQTQVETEWGDVEIGNCGNGEPGQWGTEVLGNSGDEEIGRCGTVQIGAWGNGEVGKWEEGQTSKWNMGKWGTVERENDRGKKWNGEIGP